MRKNRNYFCTFSCIFFIKYKYNNIVRRQEKFRRKNDEKFRRKKTKNSGGKMMKNSEDSNIYIHTLIYFLI